MHQQLRLPRKLLGEREEVVRCEGIEFAFGLKLFLLFFLLRIPPSIGCDVGWHSTTGRRAEELQTCDRRTRSGHVANTAHVSTRAMVDPKRSVVLSDLLIPGINSWRPSYSFKCFQKVREDGVLYP